MIYSQWCLGGRDHLHFVVYDDYVSDGRSKRSNLWLSIEDRSQSKYSTFNLEIIYE